ncbi:MAG: 2-amino-4-hydroxy-6-hydroxymethyldihydropteridine diphosphokinase [Shimia sp.]
MAKLPKDSHRVATTITLPCKCVSPKGEYVISLIALGANLPSQAGSPSDTVTAALHHLDWNGLTVTAESRIFQTPAFPPGSGPAFANAAARVKHDVAPQDLLRKLHDIEKTYARTRGVRWAGRTLDLDLIATEDTVLPDRATVLRWMNLPLDRQMSDAPDELILPHPRVQDRAFVLGPLADIAPDWRHPILGLTVTQMLAALDPEEIASVKPL